MPAQNINQPNAGLSPTPGLSDQAPTATATDVSSLPGILGILVTNKVLSTTQAQEINNAHLTSNKKIIQILQESEAVSELELTKAKSELNQIPFVSVTEAGASPEALTLVDESVAKRHQVLPFAVDHED